jgi:signal transduction histidine kinase
VAGRVIGSTPGFAGPGAAARRRVPVIARGRRVGVVAVRFGGSTLASAADRFRAERRRASLAAAGIAALLAVAVSLLVSRQVTLPLQRLLAGLRQRAAGNRSARISAAGRSELMREFAGALNESSDAVDESDRRQRDLLAGITHELRTPVAVLQATQEAMIDGITPVTTSGL